VIDRVKVSIVDGVADVRLNRPEKRNGLDLAMFEGLIDTGIELSRDTSLRAVVLSGEGPAFCAGLDFKSFMTGGDEGRARMLERDGESAANRAQRVSWIWQEVPVPVIAAIRGQAFGGGLQIALGADIRLVAPDAQLSIMEIKWGLIPDMGITQTLPTLVGIDVAKELTFSGRIFDGAEAVQLGLATRVCVDPFAEAMTMATQIAARSPHAIRNAKRLFNEAPRLPQAAALKLETELQLELLGSHNQLEAVMANFQKRTPNFKDVNG
jgi:enoyl-CoA hydratase/carnithine racemase